MAVAWLLAFAARAGASVGPAPLFVAAASVWLVYVADRLHDAGRLDRSATGRAPTLRHAFVRRHGRAFGLLWTVVLVADVAVAALALTPATLALGMGVLAIAAPTMQPRLRATALGRLARAACIGLAFAGTIVMLAPPSASSGALPLLGAFALVCMGNVLCLGVVERERDDGVRSAELPRWLPPAACGAAGAVALSAGFVTASPLGPCLAASAAVLAVLPPLRGALDPERLRVVADLALIAPLALLL